MSGVVLDSLLDGVHRHRRHVGDDRAHPVEAGGELDRPLLRRARVTGVELLGVGALARRPSMAPEHCGGQAGRVVGDLLVELGPRGGRVVGQG